MINAIVDQFFLCGAAPHVYDGWFYAFTIPQIGKEFDLLRISEDAIINIELKSQPVELRRVEKQLYQNRYYLGHLNKKIYSFTLIRDYGSMRVLSYDNGLKYSSFDEIIEHVIALQRRIAMHRDERIPQPFGAGKHRLRIVRRQAAPRRRGSSLHDVRQG